MINHARTLLANLTGSLPTTGLLGEESVPAEFQPVELSPLLETVRRVLFGAAPDRYMLNYRTRQYMTLLHATPLVSHVLALDPRVTYSTGDNPELFQRIPFRPAVTRIAGAMDVELTTLGTPVPPDHSGFMRHTYTVTIDTGDMLTVVRNSQPQTSYTVQGELTAGISPPYSLPESGYSFRVNTLESGTSWLVEFCNRPEWSLGTIAATLATFNPEVLAGLFSSVEPYKTFGNLWRDHKEIYFKLGGLLLAVIYRTNQIRNGVASA